MTAKELAEHKGHNIVVVTYGGEYDIGDAETCIECETCSVVLHSVEFNPEEGE